MDKTRYEFLKSWLTDWDFQLFPHMPIAEDDREIILALMERYEREKAYKREYRRTQRAQAFIKGLHEQEGANV